MLNYTVTSNDLAEADIYDIRFLSKCVETSTTIICNRYERFLLYLGEM